MSQQVYFVPDGTITTVTGFQAGAAFAGIKTYAEDKLDLGLLYSTNACTCAAVFTTNKITSASVKLNRKRVQNGGIRAVVVNSGIANTLVGEHGMTDARKMGDLAADQLGIPAEEVAVLNTGIIGVELPMALIQATLPKITLSDSGGNEFARAILTTDTRTKEAAVTYEYGGRVVTVGGVAKGSGMIHPDMATLLAFVATDASVEADFLQRAVKAAADQSFNMISIDRDMSTNDTLLVMANGAAGGVSVAEGTEEAGLFQEALLQLCKYLAREVVRDGEGVSRLFEVKIEGAASNEEARIAARTIASSSLVKSAVHGADPNWGRVMVALGYSGATVHEDKLALYVNDVCIMENGLPVPYFKDSIVLLMKNPEVSFRVHLNLGQGTATAWGCNLSEAYVTFNSAYTT
ncbi:MAG: bifunctional ornithine acetyltransferase/N-acetylglutamate synthase [SAR202 cluster bacterium Io17-Chloro-G3]|nr:MAG: bifunctional ornithine acetyltransferase/N-acetylglutamate synthase [SAR202 cluster bacterium Io17-Chloro-G3]